jgi:hypothetical protein
MTPTQVLAVRAWRTLFLFAVISNATWAAAPPVVTGFSPTQGPAGTVLNVVGGSLTGITSVRFEPSNFPAPAVFSAINSSRLQVTVPPRDPNSPLQQSFLVEAGTLATLVLADDAISVSSAASFMGGTHYFVVQNGGVLSGGAGSSLTYVKRGGRFNDTGGGARVVVVEAGGTFVGVGGGTARVYAASGANVTLGIGGTNTLVSLSNVSLSVVPDIFTYGAAVPEPATCILAAMGTVAAVAIRRRHRPRPGHRCYM